MGVTSRHTHWLGYVVGVAPAGAFPVGRFRDRLEEQLPQRVYTYVCMHALPVWLPTYVTACLHAYDWLRARIGLCKWACVYRCVRFCTFVLDSRFVTRLASSGLTTC